MGILGICRIYGQQTFIHAVVIHTRIKSSPHAPTDNGLRLGDIIPLLVRCRISVRVRNECESGVDEVRLRSVHQLRARDRLDLSVLVVLGGISEGQKDTTAGPGEFVSQWVVGALWGRQSAGI